MNLDASHIQANDPHTVQARQWAPQSHEHAEPAAIALLGGRQKMNRSLSVSVPGSPPLLNQFHDQSNASTRPPGIQLPTAVKPSCSTVVSKSVHWTTPRNERHRT